MSVDDNEDILILGGSYGGISTAHYLLQHVLPTLPSLHRVVLISPSTTVMCRPACPRAIISDDKFDQSKLFVEIFSQFRRYPADSFEFHQGKALAVDQAGKKVLIESPAGQLELRYHSLVIATGSSAISPLFGLGESHEALRTHWNAFRRKLATAKRIVIAGGGPTAVETAGELGEHLNGKPSWLSSASPKVKITVVTSAAQILPMLRPALAGKAERQLGSLGVQVLKNVEVEDILTQDGNATSHTVVLSDGRQLAADVYIPAVGTRANTSFLSDILLDESKKVCTSPTTMRVEGQSSMYAIGDCSTAFRPAIHLILDAVPILCHNIARDLSGADTADKIFQEDKTETQLVPIGTGGGVGAFKGWKMPEWAVWAIKGRDYWLWTTSDLWNGKYWENR